LGSRVDRHEHIGKGQIGLDAFRFMMQSPHFSKIPKVLETPKGKDLAEDVMNLKTLRRLAHVDQRRQRRHLINRIVKGY
jgi:deoxyribonuclease-4